MPRKTRREPPFTPLAQGGKPAVLRLDCLRLALQTPSQGPVDYVALAKKYSDYVLNDK